MDERKTLIKAAVDASAGRLPIIAGCSHSGTHLALELLQHARDAGADGAMVNPPYYAFTGFEGLFRHFEVLTTECDLGIMIYFSVQVRNKVQFIMDDMSLIARLYELPHLVGLKDSTGDLRFLHNVTCALGDRVAIVASQGQYGFLAVAELGCNSFVVGYGNIWPKKELQFWQAMRQGDRKRAIELYNKWEQPYLDYLMQYGVEYYWAGVKALQEMVGLPGGLMRPPLLDWPREKLPTLKAEMVRIGLMEQ
jgi:dihydrodipicolinate synthase/N-acetylneuraminate lyase